MNYFAYATAAERYARCRPYFHPLVIRQVRDFLQLREPLDRAVDVACGAGQSSLALTEIAREVIGVDASASMLAQAPGHERIRYVQGVAEELPLAEEMADLITVSLAFHWLDRPRFLAEALRILRPGGTLVIYWNDFHSRMAENPDFTRWSNEVYAVRYPTPPRNKEPLTDEAAREYGFEFAGRASYTNEQTYSPEELVRYLVTHSNVIAAVELGGESLAEVEAWLLGEVRPLFHGATGTFRFGGDVWYLRKGA
jgi:ubiquinone/menaquinone biosynthesis C-methylase UbiE